MPTPTKELLKYSLLPGVKTIAVENFLMSIDQSMPIYFHLENLKADTKLYKWNAATVTAIRKGLNHIYRKDYQGEQ